MTTVGLILFVVLAITLASVNSQEEDFFVELLNPQGFRIYIKNSPGAQRVGFRGNINEELLRRGPAQYTGEFVLGTDNLWVYEKPDVLLSPTDTLYYRVQFLTRTSGVQDIVSEFHVADDDDDDDDVAIPNVHDYDDTIGLSNPLSGWGF